MDKQLDASPSPSVLASLHFSNQLSIHPLISLRSSLTSEVSQSTDFSSPLSISWPWNLDYWNRINDDKMISVPRSISQRRSRCLVSWVQCSIVLSPLPLKPTVTLSQDVARLFKLTVLKWADLSKDPLKPATAWILTCFHLCRHGTGAWSSPKKESFAFITEHWTCKSN